MAVATESAQASQGLIDHIAHLSMRREWRNSRLLISGGVLLVFVAVAVLAPFIAPQDPLKVVSDQAASGPSASEWLGTDELGRSLISRLIYGARVSMFVSISAVAIATVLGVALGLTAAYYGGLVDMAIMRAMDVILCFPLMILVIAIVTFMGNTIPNLIVVIGVLYVPGMARIVYTTALTIKQTQYVDAARALGAGGVRIMTKHMLPNSIAPLLVQITLSLGFVILTESGLSFLGLGPPPPEPTWGQMISVGRTFIHRQPMLLLAPMLCLSVIILTLNILGDALRDVLDPRLRQR